MNKVEPLQLVHFEEVSFRHRPYKKKCDDLKNILKVIYGNE